MIHPDDKSVNQLPATNVVNEELVCPNHLILPRSKPFAAERRIFGSYLDTVPWSWGTSSDEAVVTRGELYQCLSRR
jgi:hypothetical protein